MVTDGNVIRPIVETLTDRDTALFELVVWIDLRVEMRAIYIILDEQPQGKQITIERNPAAERFKGRKRSDRVN